MMSRAEEIKILQVAIAHLGQDSYLGPALAKLVPFVEKEIRSDLEPDLLGCLELMRADVSRLEDQRRDLAERLRLTETAIKDGDANLRRLDAAQASARERIEALKRDLDRALLF